MKAIIWILQNVNSYKTQILNTDKISVFLFSFNFVLLINNSTYLLQILHSEISYSNLTFEILHRFLHPS